MTLQAASRLGVEVIVAERFPDSPAARMTSRSLVFERGWDDEAALPRLASLAPVITLESEFVDAGVLESLEQMGSRVWPPPGCVRVVQDKLLQKQTLARAELPVAPFQAIDGPRGVHAAGARLGWPLMLKTRRDGYDGRGNIVVASAAEADAACDRLGWPHRALYAESVVTFARELACLVVRGLDGDVVQYPVVETHQDARLHICREVVAPAAVSDDVRQAAADIARAAVEAVDGRGAFGVELFSLADGRVLVNELAPRPHNSAHYTIEACWTSQFENHVRAVLGLPLGSPKMRAPAAAMVNLLGTSNCPVEVEPAALAQPRTFIHLYAKAENRPGRKMGHVTAVADTANEAREAAHATASRVHV
jgi:5-(carboxyamino)imidazole ribonucleotide synthase